VNAAKRSRNLPRARKTRLLLTKPVTRSPADSLLDARASRDANGADDINYLLFWRIVRKYWATTAATMLVVVLGVVFYTLGQTKIYEATATIKFDPNPPRPLGKSIDAIVDMGSGSYWNNQEYYETQYKVIRSRRVAQAVANDLGLDHDAAFLANASAGAAVRPPQHETTSPEQAAGVLISRLKVEPVKKSRLAQITLEDADPERAQRILARVVDTYVAQNLDEAAASTTSAADWLRGQLDKLKVDLESNEMALHDFKKGKNILSVAIDDQSNMLREEMKQINEALTTVRTRREEVSARVVELQKVRADSPTELPATELLQSPLLMQLRERYSEALRDRQSLLGSGKGMKHPEVEAAEQRVEATKAALLAEVRNVQGALSRDLSVLKRQESGLSGLFEHAKSQALELNLMEIEYNRLQRSKDNTEKLYSLVLERTKESDLTRMLRVNNIQVVDRPLLPRAPVRPRVLVNIALSVLLGGLLGALAAFMRNAIDRTLKVPEDLERELQVSALGVLPLADSRAQASYGRRRRGRVISPKGPTELIVHEQPMSSIAEAARALRTNLIFMAPDKPFHTLLVTSSNPSEGKTTVACHIAIAMAQAGQRVLLMDCDLRRPRVHRIFGKTSEAGVTSAMLGDGSDDGVLGTDIPNLSILPAGPIPPNPAEMFHSERFREFLKRISSQFDRVIIDSPPVVAVTDAVILSTYADGTLLVIRAFTTRKEVAKHAINVLRDVGARMAGAVLNAVDLSRNEYKDAYSYYRRDYYARPVAPSPSSVDGPSSGASAAPH
jgi:capsular exopolysaccharide synthesis family protein